jgi:hypothetical protein
MRGKDGFTTIPGVYLKQGTPAGQAGITGNTSRPDNDPVAKGHGTALGFMENTLNRSITHNVRLMPVKSLSLNLAVEVHHLDGGHGCVEPLVAGFRPRAFDGLFEVFRGEDTE